MAVAILPQWFPDVTPQQIDEFVVMVEKDRDKFCANGVVPEKLKENCRDALRAHFKGPGLEDRLVELHLDPIKAILGNNGLCASIANHLGAKSKTDKIHEEFVEKYLERHKNDVPESTVSDVYLAAAKHHGAAESHAANLQMGA
jgi:hypothetical protein